MPEKKTVSLREGNPKAAKMWIPEKNPGRTPDSVSLYSPAKAWFRCLDNPKHEFEKPIAKMTSSRDGHNVGCIYCGPNAKLAFPGDNDFFTVVPGAKEEWDFELNSGTDPYYLRPGSVVYAWFRCKEGHTERRKVSDYTRSPGCQSCRKKSFAFENPLIYRFWDKERNDRDGIILESLTKGARACMHLKCPECSYRWIWYPKLWLNREYCPHCGYDGTEGSCERNHDMVKKLYHIVTLPERNPYMASIWDYEKNNGVVPEEIGAASPLEYWFRCEKGHSAHTSLYTLYDNEGCPRGCPACQSEQRKKDYVRLFDRYPEALPYYNQDLNEEKDPSEVRMNPKRDIWMNCPKGKHNPFRAITTCIRGVPSCPECRKEKRREKSIGNTRKDMLAFWDFTKNTLDPYETGVYSPESAYWRCKKCNYGWEQKICDRATATSGKCPCCDLRRAFSPEVRTELFESLRKHNPGAAAQMSKALNGSLTADTISYGSGKTVYLDCIKGHKPYAIQVCFIPEKPPYGCPECAREKEEEKYNRNSLMVNVPAAKKQWDPRRNKLALSEAKIWMSDTAYFICENGHSFERVIRTYAKKQDCPYCSLDSAARYPHIVNLWDFRKNKGIDINLTSSNSARKVWWKCKKCGYEWQSEVASRKMSKGMCPACEVRIITVPGVTDLFSYVPEARLDFREEDNPDVDVKSLAPTGNIRINWTCHICGYQWTTATMASRVEPSGNNTYRLKPCPKCAGMIRAKTCSERFPQLIKYYNEELNGKPFDEVAYGEQKQKLWWHCFICGNDYQCEISTKLRGESSSAKGCMYCAGKAVVRDESFASLHPEYMDEFAPDNTIDPYQVTEFSGKQAKWICRTDKTHCWTATFSSRARGHGGCPVCHIYQYETYLSDVHPEFEAFYDKELNIRPFRSYSSSSNESVNWRCRQGHSFAWPVVNFNRLGRFDCPVCRGILVQPGVNRICDRNPGLIEEWSPNNERSADEYAYNSSQPVLWICPQCSSEYSARIRDREKGDDACPYCSNRKILAGFNSFADTDPDLAREWSNNNDRQPTEFFRNSAYTALWICPECHGEYQARIRDREVGDDACPFCSNRKVLAGLNSLADTDPDLAREWSDRNDRQPTEFSRNSSYAALWVCPECHGEYSARIHNRKVGDDACPYCSNRKVLAGLNSLVDTDPDLAKEWSDRNERQPTEFFRNSAYTALWVCPECNGEYSARIRNREVGDDACPFCRNRKILAGLNSLADTDPDLAREWSDRNERQPTEFSRNSAYTALWICPKCHGEYSARIDERKVGDAACPYCSNRKILAGLNSLADTDPDLAKEWSDRNDRQPTEFFRHSAHAALWICPECHGHYLARIRNREVGDDACPFCRNRKLFAGFNSFADTDPDLAREWSDSNGRQPTEFFRNSTYIALWICPECHGQYSARIRDREVGDDACPYCTGKRVLPGFNSFMVKHPEEMEEWDHLNNYLLADPDTISERYPKKVWWICSKCGESYTLSPKQKLYYRMRKMEPCTFCKGRRRKLRRFY